MATGAHIKNLREHGLDQVSHKLSDLSGDFSKKMKKGNSESHKKMMYQKSSKYWAILSNVAALVSVATVIYSLTQKRNRWF